ncbi:MAG: hypothetical protein IJW05_11365 [Lentisphaeria bacterium]|nr:hypothetical protein [Lentisphaeria bacterium]
MSALSEFLGMHWTLAVTILCIIMLVIDLFIFNGGGLTFAADVLFSFVILHFIPTDNLIWLALWFLVIFGIVLAFHLLCYQKFIVVFLMDKLAPQKRKNNNEILIGKIGKICWIEERAYIYLEDEHIPCTFGKEFSQTEIIGKKAKVISWKDSSEVLVEIAE